jgi:hypothetical protein
MCITSFDPLQGLEPLEFPDPSQKDKVSCDALFDPTPIIGLESQASSQVEKLIFWLHR